MLLTSTNVGVAKIARRNEAPKRCLEQERRIVMGERDPNTIRFAARIAAFSTGHRFRRIAMGEQNGLSAPR